MARNLHPAELPNELWIEIFKNFNVQTLLNVSCVCKHWNRLIFSHMAHRIQLSLDLDSKKHPKVDGEMAPERPYKHLKLRSFKLNCPTHMLNIIKQLAVNLESLCLDVVYLEGAVFVELLPLFGQLKKISLKATYFEYDARLYGCRETLPAVRQLSFNVTNYVSTFNSFSFEMAFLRVFPSVRELEVTVSSLLDLGLLKWMAPRLKKLTLRANCWGIGKILDIKFPVLEHFKLDRLLPEHYCHWHSRQIFQTSKFEKFLRDCPALKNVRLLLRCDYDQPLLNAIFASLPVVENLHLDIGFAKERMSFDGMEQMARLKELSLDCMLYLQPEQRIVPMPSVEKLSLCYFRAQLLSDFLKRFPNLKSLSFQMHGDELESIKESAPVLEDLHLNLHRLTPQMINQLGQLMNLKKLVIDSHTIARTNFRALGKVIVLPTLQCFQVNTRSTIPPNVASLVAADNRSCKLFLNGALVAPSTRARRSGVKRKQPSANPNQPSASDAAVVASNPETENADQSAMKEDGELSFATAQCSSPKRPNISDQNGLAVIGDEKERSAGASGSADSGIGAEPVEPDDTVA